MSACKHERLSVLSGDCVDCGAGARTILLQTRAELAKVTAEKDAALKRVAEVEGRCPIGRALDAERERDEARAETLAVWEDTVQPMASFYGARATLRRADAEIKRLRLLVPAL